MWLGRRGRSASSNAAMGRLFQVLLLRESGKWMVSLFARPLRAEDLQFLTPCTILPSCNGTIAKEVLMVCLLFFFFFPTIYAYRVFGDIQSFIFLYAWNCREPETNYRFTYMVSVICQEEAWFDTASILESESDEDFSSVYGGNDEHEVVCYSIWYSHFCELSSFLVIDFFPSRLSGQVIQYEVHERYIKLDGSKTDKLTNKDFKEPKGLALLTAPGYELPSFKNPQDLDLITKKKLDRNYGSFNFVTSNRHDTAAGENVLKSVLPKMGNSLSFNDKIINASNSGICSQTRTSTVIRLSITQINESQEAAEAICKSNVGLLSKFVIQEKKKKNLSFTAHRNFLNVFAFLQVLRKNTFTIQEQDS